MALRNRRLAELILFAGLTLLHTWPLASNPAHLSRLDNDDTAFNTWVVAWVEHALLRDPLHLFEAPIFYPEHDTLAYSEHMVVPAIIGLPFHWARASPVLVYNLLVIVAFILSGIAMSRLMTKWTGSFAAGVIAGALFSFNAHVLTRFPHLQALHVEFIPVVLYAFDRVLEEGRARHAVLLGVSFALQALCSNYMAVMLAFGLAAALVVRSETWTRSRAVWPQLALAGSGAALVILPFLVPYYRLHQTQGLIRTIEDVRIYSAGWQDYLATTGRLHYTFWSYRFAQDRTALFPGLVAMALCLVAVVSGTAWRDPRARMAVAFGALGFTLSFGANLPGYAWLQDHVLPLQGIRAAARWGYLMLVAVAILAGYGVAALQARLAARSWWPALVVGLAGLVTIEALRAPLSLVRFDGIAPVHSRLRSDDVHAIVMYPLYEGSAFYRNAPYLLDQTRHWKPLVNGYSSFAAASFFERARRFNRFPDAEVIAEMRRIGVSHVMVAQRAFAAQLRSHPELEFVLDQDGWTVYKVR